MMQTSVVLVQARLAAAKAPKGHLPQLWQSTAVSLPPGIQKGWKSPVLLKWLTICRLQTAQRSKLFANSETAAMLMHSKTRLCYLLYHVPQWFC
jgi:hypothetical protein